MTLYTEPNQEHRHLVESLRVVVDLRGLRADERAERLMRMYRRLMPDEGFVFVDDCNPSPLLEMFQDRHGGEFDWLPVLGGPAAWRVALIRRHAGASRVRQIAELMTTEHRRMKQLLVAIRELAAQPDWEEAARFCAYLESCFERHARMEEQTLLPFLFDASNNPDLLGPEDLCPEHRRIGAVVRQLRSSVMDALQADPPTAAIERELVVLSEQLEGLFDCHVAKEERSLYLLVDALLDADETAQMVADLQRRPVSTPSPLLKYEELFGA